MKDTVIVVGSDVGAGYPWWLMVLAIVGALCIALGTFLVVGVFADEYRVARRARALKRQAAAPTVDEEPPAAATAAQVLIVADIAGPLDKATAYRDVAALDPYEKRDFR